MKKIIWSFLILIVFYHIIITIFGYGFFPQLTQTMISFSRDILRIMIVGIFILGNLDRIVPYLKKWKYLWLTFIMLILFGVGISLLNSKGLSDIFIGLKYGFYYLRILLSASFIGFVGYNKIEKKDFLYLLYFIVGIVILGFIRQGAKIFYPDFFFNIGYGPLNDFLYGQNPPLYYLTGFEGTMRRQGVFSGPNNYGYFLVAFFPILLIWIGKIINKGKTLWGKINIIDLFLIFIWMLAGILTLSRGTFIGIIIALIITYTSQIRKHKKLFSILLGVLIFAIIGLSIMKWESTLGHIQSKILTLPYILQNSLGYGLGSSGPAIHHNGRFLPENYFFQLILDIGNLGFIIWTFLIRQIIILIKKIVIFTKNNKLDEKQQIAYLHLKAFFVGFFCLLVVGMFLHVFEDSMVNYIFFIPMGIVLGYFSHNIKSIKIKDIISFKYNIK